MFWNCADSFVFFLQFFLWSMLEVSGMVSKLLECLFFETVSRYVCNDLGQAKIDSRVSLFMSTLILNKDSSKGCHEREFSPNMQDQHSGTLLLKGMSSLTNYRAISCCALRTHTAQCSSKLNMPRASIDQHGKLPHIFCIQSKPFASVGCRDQCCSWLHIIYIYILWRMTSNHW